MSAEKPEPKLWTGLYGDYLFNYAMYRVNKQEIARDLVQDTFLAALKSMDSFRGEASEKTWLTSILKRKIIDHYRKASNRLEVSSDEKTVAPAYEHYFNDEDTSREGHWKDDSAPKDWGNASAKIENTEFLKILNGCLMKLPEKWSAVFNLKLFEEENADKICKELELSPSNYWVILHRARLQLRECLERNWFVK